ncbi:MAG: class C sortase [Oscillospiraceae bacterium]|nr:class C sortase [Oscillospiraceae bacterium]
MNKKKLSDYLVTAGLILIMLTGTAIALYPAFSSWWNERTQTRVIDRYNQAVGSLDTSEKEKMLENAHAYNDSLSALYDPLSNYEKIADYGSVLKISGTDIIGYIDIPKIGVHLPIYNGTSPEVLNVAVGHLEGTSLPVGGKGCHAVISAHRGLPSAKLFTELDKLTEDDQFSISVLDDIFTYEVDQISVVLPYERDLLLPEPGKDLVTLMTCTPYGINTHRLLVRGRRVDNITEEEEVRRVRIPADAIVSDELSSRLFIIVPLALILLIYWYFGGRDGRKRYHSVYPVLKALDRKDEKERNGDPSCGKQSEKDTSSR